MTRSSTLPINVQGREGWRDDTRRVNRARRVRRFLVPITEMVVRDDIRQEQRFQCPNLLGGGGGSDPCVLVHINHLSAG
jgi:hypothetical protein